MNRPYLLYRDVGEGDPDVPAGRRFFSYGRGLIGVDIPGRFSWLSKPQVGAVQASWKGIVDWALLPEEETLIHRVMDI